MPSESGDQRRPMKPGAPPPEPEHLPCPRCDSTNTKFCYYNNYNFSQPRHFCKSCRRYWTHGGTLRDIPVGGGSRKNAKRSRTLTPAAAAANNNNHHHHPVFVSPAGGDHAVGGVPFAGQEQKPGLGLCGGFSSLLGNQGPGGGGGFLALGGFGLGIGPGFEEMGFGLGRAVWPFPGMGEGIGATGPSSVSNTWQLESGEGGFVGGDCFSFPDLAISTTGNGLK